MSDAESHRVLKFGLALNKLMAQDAAVHKLVAEIQHLLRPRAAVLQDPELMPRVMAVMAEA